MKIAVTGPECSGKTTLCKAISRELNLTFIKEYAREYLNDKGINYSQYDIIQIAKKQFELSQKLNSISDTEMLVCAIWYEEKTANQSPEIEELIKKQQFDLYVLCEPSIDWEYDSLRENQHDRDRLYEKYLFRLKNLNLPFIVVKGDLTCRVNMVFKHFQS